MYSDVSYHPFNLVPRVLSLLRESGERTLGTRLSSLQYQISIFKDLGVSFLHCFARLYIGSEESELPLTNAVVSRPFTVVSVAGDRIHSISYNKLYVSFPSY